ncbi:MAG: molybdenum cofactor guanylyltransferase [Thermoplasmata archaeon]|nr:MAG: molybdenum cofactor guanylyltransferase [Thermoplasmata archaeon]
MNSSIILAGGESSRFGKNKSLLELDNKPLITWVISALANFGELIISISSEDDISIYDNLIGHPHKFIIDIIHKQGPFGGLLSAATASEGEYIAFAPCDAPLVTEELYEILFEAAKGAEGAVPKINGYWEPLVAVYKKDPLITLLETNLKLNKIRLGLICETLDIREVRSDELAVQNIGPEHFLNINTPEDLEKAENIIKNRIYKR